ncbi:hypothetical protein HYH03_016596 [Edaphochlamys debaryana]|uniref:CCHC-type domain-containing protein n=1 Tax=Edaphochlamys debaryana TaxID=47281 RepID=A0A835XKU3_9CHLO|nr:hypothetical protein HYH03_016596 [Edaphochlamys debaryana]|eukprot:KAG2484643.1 hypothetical protein HYH03_016596 [Edaphochlamys debaryana]
MSTTDQIAALKARIAELKQRKVVKNALQRLEDDPDAKLTGPQQIGFNQLCDAENELAILEADPGAEEEEVEEEARAEAPPRKKAKFFGPRENFKCDFGAGEGKGNKSLIGQRQTLEELFKVAVVDVGSAFGAVQAAVDAKNGAGLSAALLQVDAALGASQEKFVEIAREYVIAYEHGWNVVKELRGAAYLRNDAERKALKEAIKAAHAKGKPTGAGAGGSGAKGQQPGGKPPAMPGVDFSSWDKCKKCGKTGHWAVNCPEK